VLTVLGTGAPATLKVFVTALALVDDLGVIGVIAFHLSGGSRRICLSRCGRETVFGRHRWMSESNYCDHRQRIRRSSPSSSPQQAAAGSLRLTAADCADADYLENLNIPGIQRGGGLEAALRLVWRSD
jgi:hypothetical protein